MSRKTGCTDDSVRKNRVRSSADSKESHVSSSMSETISTGRVGRRDGRAFVCILDVRFSTTPLLKVDRSVHRHSMVQRDSDLTERQ